MTKTFVPYLLLTGNSTPPEKMASATTLTVRRDPYPGGVCNWCISV